MDKYNLVVRRRALFGHDINVALLEAKEVFGEFNFDDGEACTLLKDVDLEAAKSARHKLESIGLLCNVVPGLGAERPTCSFENAIPLEYFTFNQGVSETYALNAIEKGTYHGGQINGWWFISESPAKKESEPKATKASKPLRNQVTVKADVAPVAGIISSLTGFFGLFSIAMYGYFFGAVACISGLIAILQNKIKYSRGLGIIGFALGLLVFRLTVTAFDNVQREVEKAQYELNYELDRIDRENKKYMREYERYMQDLQKDQDSYRE